MAWLKGHVGDVLAVASLGDALVITAGHDTSILVWDIKQRTVKQRLGECHTHLISSLSLCTAEAESLLLSGSWDCSVKVWDLGNGKLRRVLVGHTKRVTAVIWARWGGRVVGVTGGSDGHVIVWDLSTGEKLRSFAHAPHSVTALATLESRAGACLLVSADSDRSLKLWALGAGERENGQEEGPSAEVVLDDPCSCLCVLAAQSLAPRLACGLNSGRILLFEVAAAESGRELLLRLLSLDAHTQKVTDLCSSSITGGPSSSYFFSASKDGHLKSWSLEQLERDQGEARGAGINVSLCAGRPGLKIFGCCSLPTEQPFQGVTDDDDRPSSLSHEDLAVVTSDGCLAILAVSTVGGRQECLSQGDPGRPPEEIQQRGGFKISARTNPRTRVLPDISKGKRPPPLVRPSNSTWRLEDDAAGAAAEVDSGGEILLTPLLVPLLAPLSPDSVIKARRTARPIIRAQSSSTSPLVLASPTSSVVEEMAACAIQLQAELSRRKGTKGTRENVLGSLMRKSAIRS